jgi:hypothetical protein
VHSFLFSIRRIESLMCRTGRLGNAGFY